MSEHEGLASSGSPSAATALGSLQPGVRDMALSDAIKSGDLNVGLGLIEVV